MIARITPPSFGSSFNRITPPVIAQTGIAHPSRRITATLFGDVAASSDFDLVSVALLSFGLPVPSAPAGSAAGDDAVSPTGVLVGDTAALAGSGGGGVALANAAGIRALVLGSLTAITPSSDRSGTCRG